MKKQKPKDGTTAHHGTLLATASEAIDQVYADKSVPPARTRESMEELSSQIDARLDALIDVLADDDDDGE